jgi:hypothetical protein
MRRTGWIAAAACAVVAGIGGAQLVGADGADNNDRGRRRCSAATIRGDYGIQLQGTGPAPGGLTESVIGVVLRTYDGRGNIEQVDNVKGSITGIVPDRPGFGTYEVSPDCTGVARFEPGPGIVIEEKLVIVDDGREIRSIVASPASRMITGVHQRIHTR